MKKLIASVAIGGVGLLVFYYYYEAPFLNAAVGGITLSFVLLLILYVFDSPPHEGGYD